jgi:hypothetical protein
MRLVWSTHQNSVPIAIAANVFVSAGVIIIIIINLMFTQRLLRASYPAAGWHTITRYLFLTYYLSIVLLLMALIVSIIQQSYTLNGNIRRIDHDIQLIGATYNSFAAFAPIPILMFGIIPNLRSGPHIVNKFDIGRFRTQIRIIITSTLLMTLGAAFRMGIAYVPRPANDPAWYHSKACFYCFNFSVEIIVIYLFVVARVDRRFHIPNGASGVGDYSTGKGKMERRIVSEEEFLDNFKPLEAEAEGNGKSSTGNEARTGIREPPASPVA